MREKKGIKKGGEGDNEVEMVKGDGVEEDT